MSSHLNTQARPYSSKPCSTKAMAASSAISGLAGPLEVALTERTDLSPLCFAHGEQPGLGFARGARTSGIWRAPDEPDKIW